MSRWKRQVCFDRFEGLGLPDVGLETAATLSEISLTTDTFPAATTTTSKHEQVMISCEPSVKNG